MSRLEGVANVLLRVPCVLLLDLLYRWDAQDSALPTYGPAHLHPHLLWGLYCLGHVVCTVLATLPLRHLVDTYLYLLTSLLLYVAHRTLRDYLAQEMASHHLGAVYEDQASLTRSISTLTGLVMVCTLCSLLMRTRQAWLFSAPVLPLLVRLAGVPLYSLPLLNAVSTGLTLLVMSYVGLSGLGALRRLFSRAYRELTQDMEVYRLVALVMALWTQLAVSALFLVFWLVLYLLHIYMTLSSKPELLDQQGAVFILLNSASECCVTPYCLLGLTCTVSYVSRGMLNLCKFYLMGYAAFQNGNIMHRGVTEGVTLMLLSLQTGLLELQVLQRTFLLSIIFFIVLTSTLQSMIQIADPLLLALAATRNRSVWRHVRGLSLCLFLLFFPCFMAYEIAYFFHMDFWLLILVSSCLLTSLQVLGTLFLYSLFMIELLQESRVERMDEIIYGVNATSRVLEFLVALSVVAYGSWESIFGEWSWMGVSVIIVHSYFNVWLRAQSGWRSFLLRRKAASKIDSLPRATEEQLRAHSDVCSICYQDMSVAVITTCGHFFHPDCLKKWLYVQDSCPLCHQPVRAEEGDAGEEEDEEESEIPESGGENGIHSGGESVRESQGGDLGAEAETGTIVRQNASLCLGAEDVPGEVVDQALDTQAEEILHRSEEVLCRKEIPLRQKEEGQEEVMDQGHDRKRQEILYRSEEVLCRQEIRFRQKEEEQEEVLDYGHDRRRREILYRSSEVLCREEIPFRQKEEEQEEVMDQENERKRQDIHHRSEEVLCRQDIPFRQKEEEQEEVMDRGHDGKRQEIHHRSQEVLCRKEIPFRQKEGHDSRRQEILHRSEEVFCRQEIPFRQKEEEQEEVMDRGHDGTRQEILHRSQEVLCRKEQEEQKKEQGVNRKRQDIFRSEALENESSYEVDVHCMEEQEQEIRHRELPYRQKQQDKNHPRDEKYQGLSGKEPKRDLYREDQNLVPNRDAEENWEEDESMSHRVQVHYQKDEEDISVKEQKVVLHEEAEPVYRDGGEMAKEGLIREGKGGHS